MPTKYYTGLPSRRKICTLPCISTSFYGQKSIFLQVMTKFYAFLPSFCSRILLLANKWLLLSLWNKKVDKWKLIFVFLSDFLLKVQAGFFWPHKVGHRCECERRFLFCVQRFSSYYFFFYFYFIFFILYILSSYFYLLFFSFWQNPVAYKYIIEIWVSWHQLAAFFGAKNSGVSLRNYLLWYMYN